MTDTPKNPHAQALARLARGVKKRLTEEERKARGERFRVINEARKRKREANNDPIH